MDQSPGMAQLGTLLQSSTGGNQHVGQGRSLIRSSSWEASASKFTWWLIALSYLQIAGLNFVLTVGPSSATWAPFSRSIYTYCGSLLLQKQHGRESYVHGITCTLSNLLYSLSQNQVTAPANTQEVENHTMI